MIRKRAPLAGVNYFKERIKVIDVDGLPGVKEVSAEALLKKLG